MVKDVIDALDVPTQSNLKTKRSMLGLSDTLAGNLQPPQAFVDAGSIVTFDGNVSRQTQEDVLNSSLLAQVASDHRHDRATEVIDWHNYYSHIMNKIGWSDQGFKWQKYTSPEATFTMNEAIVDIANSILTDQEVQIVVDALDALLKLPKEGSHRMVFDHSAMTDETASFRISVCNQDNDTVTMKSMAFYFDVKQQDTNILLNNFNSASNPLNQAIVSQTLNRQFYDQIRASVVAKLGPDAAHYVLDLDI